MWGFYCKDDHKECKDNQQSKKSIFFADSYTNKIFYLSCLMTTNEDFMDKEQKG